MKAHELPGWRWLPGMAGLTTMHDKVTRWRLYLGSGDLLCAQGEPAGYIAGWETTAPIMGAVPDWTDPATGGCALVLLGRGVDLRCGRIGGDVAWWLYFLDGEHWRHGSTYPTAGEACAAMAEALGRWPGGMS